MHAVDRLFSECDVFSQEAGDLGLEIADAEGLGGVDSGNLAVLTDEATFHFVNRVGDQHQGKREELHLQASMDSTAGAGSLSRAMANNNDMQ